MNVLYGLKEAYEGVVTNKVRSFLTTLGIVIGITAIILIVSIGKGAEQLILTQVEGLGADTIVIRPGKEPAGFSDVAASLFSDSLTSSDIDALEKSGNVPDIVEVAPSVVVAGSVSHGREIYTPVMFGWRADFMSDMFNVYPAQGMLFDQQDIEQKARVVVIGSKVKDELFEGEDALGKDIKIRDQNFRVVGVFPQYGQVMFFNIDDLVLIPYSTAQTYLLGIDHFHEVIVRVNNPENIDRAVFDIEATLREQHGIDDPEDDDFYVETQQGVVDQIGTILSVMTLFLASVVAISLVVGGIGVMNIMLVSVTERTKEIGLRKAIGATNKDIMTQFLLESMLLTFVGGVIGITIGVVLSVIASWGLSYALNDAWTFTFPLSAALLGVAVSTLVGLIFGLYPARKAARMSPIEALRYE